MIERKILIIILIFTYCVSFLGRNAIYKILRIGSRERRHFINNTFKSFTRQYYVGFIEFLTNAMSIVISDFYTMINLYTIRPSVAESFDVEVIRQRRNTNTDWNDNFNPFLPRYS